MSVSDSRRAGGLPPASDDFVGRERELDSIGTLLLRSIRLITLIGPGGIGKTRLATEVVHRFRKARPVPVHWVRLARLPKGADASAVEDEVVRSVVDADFSGRSGWQALVDTLSRSDAVGRRLHTVLVMDNCEHVVEGAGAIIVELLDTVPGLTVLTTSREVIGWPDEHLVPIPPLTRNQALSLFRRRAELSGHVIADGDQATQAESICEHLHNHPLNIRLAAARLRRQPLSMILRDLSGEATDRRLYWPTAPHVGHDRRHRAIGDVIAWSFDLCNEKEQLLFERMSVFAAGYDVNPDDDGNTGLDVGADVEAIIAVCAGAGSDGTDLRPEEIAGLLERLADQSLVSVHLTTDTVRYSLLESLRVFAIRRLSDDERVRLAARHRRYYRDKVAIAGAEWFSTREQDLLYWARAAWDNLLCAIDSSTTTPEEASVGLEIAVGLVALRIPFFKGSLREARSWAERTLKATLDLDPAPVELQITALAQLAWISLCQGVPDDAERMLDDCVRLCLPDRNVSVDPYRDSALDIGLPAPAEFTRGCYLMLVRGDSAALEILARARERCVEAGEPGAAAMSELFEALTAGFYGTAEQAIEVTRRHLDTATRAGAQWAQSWAELAWAIAETKHGDPSRALGRERVTLTNQLEMRDQWGALWAVHIRTWTLAHTIITRPADARPDRVKIRAIEIAQLLGGLEVVRRQLGVEISNLAPFAAETTVTADIARTILGSQEFDLARQEGALLCSTLDDVAGLALGTVSLNKLPTDHMIRELRPSPWRQLSVAEQEVAVLAAAGWTNSAIAARRGSSHRTVDAQIAAVLHKLMISSRDDIVAFIPADQQDRLEREIQQRPPGTRRPIS